MLSEAGVNLIRLEAILGELKKTIGPISGASGKDVVELMMLDELKN